jgi:mannose-6-phosphate isomerase-like protein (cupin superfamily)
MIYKVFPSLNDYENFSRLKVYSSDFANTFDYHNIVVNKPWGYEYLWYQNDAVAIWFLYLKEGHSTSLHCHARKRTSLIVLDGEVECTTLDDKYRMKTLEGVVLEACVFHSSKAVSPMGAYIMEIETPPMKGDLVRMNDTYGRQNSGYETTNQYSTDFGQYEFRPFLEKDYNNWAFKNIVIKRCCEKIMVEDSTRITVPISGHIKKDNKIVIESGEAVLKNSDILLDDIFDPHYQFLTFNLHTH